MSSYITDNGVKAFQWDVRLEADGQQATVQYEENTALAQMHLPHTSINLTDRDANALAVVMEQLAKRML